jgi:flavin reductase (DIM6/NTAB) family NADH-FMN oxidoreductase RutF
MTIQKALFRQVMGQFATGVTVATTSNKGTLAGLTVNSFCSVSLNPPLVLVCIDLKSTALQHFRESNVVAINILTEKQEQWSRGFATNSPERFEHFCYAPYHTAATGAPIIDNALAFVDARIIAEYPGGDHAIFIAQVEALGMADQAAFIDETGQEQGEIPGFDKHNDHEETHPLIYYAGQYRHIMQHFHEPSLIKPQENNIEEPAKGR